VILAFGKHGGEELNYSSDLDLMFVYDEEGSTRGRRVISIDNGEVYARVLREGLRLLSAHTHPRPADPLDLPPPPARQRGPPAPKDNAARSPGRSPARCRTTTPSAAPGNARPSSSSVPSPAT